MLRNHEIAQIALRDTLVVAEAHIGRLADPELLGPWLYSLARAECCRRRAVQPSLADEPPARPSQRDADNRLMAWNAVTSMGTDELEALDLTCRHEVDLALVLGIPAEDAEELLNRATQSLERALGAEVLIAEGGDGCTERADILDGWVSGTVTPLIRERLMRHAEDCPLCQLDLPQNVSAARVFAQLPAPELSPLVRAQVLGLFANPKLSAYRDFAVNWASALGESGFPVTSESGGPEAVAPEPGASEHGVPERGPFEPFEPFVPERGSGAAETATALAGVSTEALPVFGPGEDELPADDLLEAEWPTTDLPAVKAPEGEAPALCRPIADVPAARRPMADAPPADVPAVDPSLTGASLADALLADWAGTSVSAASSRMASPQVATSAELWFAPAKPAPAQQTVPAPAKPEPVSSAKPASFVPAAFTPATLRPAAEPKPGNGATPGSAPGYASPAKPAALWPAPASSTAASSTAAKPAAVRPTAPKSATAKPTPVAGAPAPGRPAGGGGRPRHVRRNRAILAGVGTMAAAAAIVSSFALSGGGGSSGKLVVAGGAAASAGRATSSPAGLSASSAPILERQSGARTLAGSPVSKKAPKSVVSSTPPLVPANVKRDKGQVLIANATQPPTQPVPAPNPGAPEQLVIPTPTPTPTPTSTATSTASSPSASAPAGTLTISPATLDLGTGSAGQVTLTAVGGPVSWLAGSPSGLITLSSYSGTLPAGQSVRLRITVTRSSQSASALIWLEPPASAPQNVLVDWPAQPGPSGRGWQHDQQPPAASPLPPAASPLPPAANASPPAANASPSAPLPPWSS
jgi:hypothetical protein